LWSFVVEYSRLGKRMAHTCCGHVEVRRGRTSLALPSHGARKQAYRALALAAGFAALGVSVVPGAILNRTVRAGRDEIHPTSGFSVQIRRSGVGGGVVIGWGSASGTWYDVWRSTNLTVNPQMPPPLATMQAAATNTEHVDVTATGPGPYFYHVAHAPAPHVGFKESWSGTTLATWTNAGPWGTEYAELSNPQPPQNPANYLRIHFADAGTPTVLDDTIYSQNASYTGNYARSDLGLRFRFLGEDTAPTELLVWLLASDGTVWNLVLDYDGDDVGTWVEMTVRFDYNYSYGWVGGSEQEFLTDLQNIVAAGIFIGADMWFEQDYGLDDWEYFRVSEP
jgi:hypothetical protein